MKTMTIELAELSPRTTIDEGAERIPVSKKALMPATIHPSAVIGHEVQLGKGVWVGPKVVIDDGVILGDRVRLEAGVYLGQRCQVGDDCILEPHVTVMDGCILGRGVRIHSGAVIGSDGFGFARTETGSRYKIPQVGIVEIGDGAVIGANCTIDRATLGRTVIGRGAVIEALVQIAHNVRVGEGSVVGCQSGICGSSTIGSGVKIGANVGVVGHVKISDGSQIEKFSGISKNVPANSHLTGYPAVSPEEDEERRRMERELPTLYDRVKRIEKALKGKLNKD